MTHTPITAEQKAFFLKERQAIVNTKIDHGEFQGYVVEQHIKGSLYRLSVFASHDKQTDVWKIWEDRTK